MFKNLLKFVRERKRKVAAAIFAILALVGVSVPGPQQEFVIELFDKLFAEQSIEQPIKPPEPVTE